MTTEHARINRENLEAHILRLIAEFERESECDVIGIQFAVVTEETNSCGVITTNKTIKIIATV